MFSRDILKATCDNTFPLAVKFTSRLSIEVTRHTLAVETVLNSTSNSVSQLTKIISFPEQCQLQLSILLYQFLQSCICQDLGHAEKLIHRRVGHSCTFPDEQQFLRVLLSKSISAKKPATNMQRLKVKNINPFISANRCEFVAGVIITRIKTNLQKKHVWVCCRYY